MALGHLTFDFDEIHTSFVAPRTMLVLPDGRVRYLHAAPTIEHRQIACQAAGVGT